MKMWMFVLVLVGCRTEDDPVVVEDSAGLTQIGDVDAMAAAWCAVLECRDGFEDGFDSVDDCTEFYSNYWGNPDWDNNQRECFEDVEAVDACVEALQVTECGGDTPAVCEAFMVCDDPDTGG